VEPCLVVAEVGLQRVLVDLDRVGVLWVARGHVTDRHLVVVVLPSSHRGDQKQGGSDRQE
jgi:hypothetical protein